MGKIAQIQYRAGLLLLLFLAGCGGGGGSTEFAPQVVKTDPGNEAGNVPVNAPIRATFSYDIDPVTVNKETFIVSNVQGTVSYQDKTAIFTPPGAGLEKGKQYNAILTTGVKDLDGIPLPSNFIWSFQTEGNAPPLTLSVTATVPKEDAKGVSVKSSIEVIFSKSVEPLTVRNPKNFFIQGVEAESIQYQEADKKAIFKPRGQLKFGTRYTVTVTRGIQDIDGNSLAGNHVWSFETEAVPDIISPVIAPEGLSPKGGELNAPVGTDITVKFNESVDEASIRAALSVRAVQGAIVSGKIEYDNDTVTFDPTADLSFNTQYQVTVKAGVKDLSGNLMASDQVWAFTTEQAPDTIRPSVIGRSPPPSEREVSVKSTIMVTFSEPMNLESVQDPEHFVVDENGGANVLGEITYTPGDSQAIFTPKERWKYNTTYLVFLADKMHDHAGNDLHAAFWQFTTTTSPPQVSEQWPKPDEQDVATQREIAAQFSRPMNAATINEKSFEVVQLSPSPGKVEGTIQYNDFFNVAFFRPTFPLSEGAVYQVTLSTDVEDHQQNPLENSVVWTFRTVLPQPDTTPPQVSSTFPEPGATSIQATNPDSGEATQLRVIFSEAIRAESIHLGSFIVEKVEANLSRRTISGAIRPLQNDPTTFFFVPDPPLDRGGSYEARLTTGITDLAGNPLWSGNPSQPDYSWSFTTAP